jgi:hypothetical protein
MAKNMATHVKSNVVVLGKIRERNFLASFSLDVHLRYFCEIEFLSPLFPYEVMSNILGDHLF